MYCSFCGKEIRDGATFCSQCGKNQQTGKMKQGVSASKSGLQALLSNKKAIISIVSVLVAVVLIVVCVNAFGSKSIVGVWMDGTDKITFTSDGDFQMDSTYGTYTIDDDKTLIMSSGEYSYWSGRWEYEYGPEAKEDSDYWYISGGKLYFRGGEYTKK